MCSGPKRGALTVRACARPAPRSRATVQAIAAAAAAAHARSRSLVGRRAVSARAVSLVARACHGAGYLLDAEFKGDDKAFVAFLNVFGDALHAANLRPAGEPAACTEAATQPRT